MDYGEEPEPAPLKPGRSDGLCVLSGRQPWEERRAGFGPSEQSLSRTLPAAQRDASPPPPSERSLSRPPSARDLQAIGEAEAPDGAAEAPAPRAARELPMAVWLADAPRVLELLKADADVNAVDERGATPLMLAVELLPRARDYEVVLQHLLEFEADPRAKSALGWSPLDEAVSRGDERLVRLLFECTQQSLKLRWEERLRSVQSALQVLPDFECRIRWEFESPVLPLFNKIAPSDVLHLRKRGTSLRLDSTLASWKRFRLSKRRDLSTLFRGGESGGSGSTSSTSPKKTGPSLCQLNHCKSTVTDMTEGLDTEESGAIVEDLVSADVMQWDMQVNDLEVAEATTWLGQVAPPSEVNGWRATRFDVRGSLGVVCKKKGSRRNHMTFEEYFGCPLPADACLPEFRQEFAGCASPTKGVPAMMSRQNSRGSNWSEYTDASVPGFQSQKQLIADCMFPQDLDEVSTCSEVLSQWPEPASALTGHEMETKVDSARQRMLYTGRPACPDGDVGPSPSSLRRRIQGEPSLGEMSSNSASSTASGRGGWKSGLFGRSAKKEVGDKVGKTTHRVSASVWLASDFAIPILQFLPVLEALSAEHEAMRRLKELLNSQALRDAFERARVAAEAAAEAAGEAGSRGHVFPVKVSVPLNLAVRALVHFEAFELKKPDVLPPELFEVPRGYSVVHRKESQKTVSRSKKRNLLAQLAL